METAIGTAIGILFGGLITWFASRHFYVKAGKELREEATKLRQETQEVRQVAHAILGAQLNPNAELEPTLDAEGKIVGITVGAVGKM